MRLHLLSIAALFLAVLGGPSRAFERCDSDFRDARAFADEAVRAAIGRTPVKYRDIGDAIRLVVDVPAPALMPFATEQQGRKVVVLTPAFARLACQMSLATYLNLENDRSENFAQASRTAAACLDAGKPQSVCLLAFGDDLAARYRQAYARLDARAQSTAMGLFRGGLWQILQHEYAHHYLNHLRRIAAKQVTRIDAEFEADLEAVTNGVQTGEAVTSMYYFFHGLADIEKATRTLSTPDYESGACRASNVENITGFVGILPLVLLDAAGGGGVTLSVNSPTALRAAVRDRRDKGVPSLGPDACGRIAKVALGRTHAELMELGERLGLDAELLFSVDKEIDAERAVRLVADVAAMAERFQYVDGIATKSLAYMLRNWGLKGRDRTPLIGTVDRILANAKLVANLQSDDYGRLLSSQALAVLQGRADLPAAVRLERASQALQKAVRYNPLLTEAWMNLAFIAFMRGDCSAAAAHAARSVATHTSDDRQAKESAAFFAQSMKQWSTDPATCKAEGAKFRPYRGL